MGPPTCGRRRLRRRPNYPGADEFGDSVLFVCPAVTDHDKTFNESEYEHIARNTSPRGEPSGAERIEKRSEYRCQ